MRLGRKIITTETVDNIDKLKEVITDFTSTVTSTLGPGGRTIIIQTDESAVPHVTKDGVSVAEAIHYSDNFKQSIVSLLKESARKTADEVGDGTTTSTLLAGKLILEGLKVIPKTKNRRQFFAGINDYGSRLIDYIDDCKKIIVNDKDIIKNIIKISSNNDEKVLELLSDIVDSVGVDGLINVELADSNTTNISVSNGASIDSVCHTIDKGTKELTSPFVLLVEGPIHKQHEIVPALEVFAANKKPVIVVAKEFSKEISQVVKTNNMRGALNVHLIDAEGFGSSRSDILKDISLITGAKIVSTDGSTTEMLREFDISWVGTAEKIIVGPKETTIIPYSDHIEQNQKTIDETVKDLREILNSKNIDEGIIRNTKRRLSKFTKVATIRVGGSTHAEAVETKDRVDDAVCAISSAINGGVIPGAGSILYIAGIKLMLSLEKEEKINEDFKVGAQILLSSCLTPIRKIIENAGLVMEDYAEDIFNLKEGQTINVITGEIVDAYDVGIIDPVMSSIKAVENAISIAKTILNSSAVIVEDAVIEQ